MGSRTGGRAFRGLFLVFVLTFVNFAGILLTITSVGGLKPWTEMQFLGLFGLIEASAGISNVFAPNIWRLPAAEMGTGRRTAGRLAATTMLIPHWGGAARAAAGVILCLVSGFATGWVPASLLLLPLAAALCVLFLGVSAAIARVGVAHPETDTVQFVLRWRGSEREMEPLSLSASVQQFVLGILALPAVSVLTPGALFGDGFRPSTALFIVSLGLALLSIAATVLMWSGRLQWKAPPEQQAEAEANA